MAEILAREVDSSVFDTVQRAILQAAKNQERPNILPFVSPPKPVFPVFKASAQRKFNRQHGTGALRTKLDELLTDDPLNAEPTVFNFTGLRYARVHDTPTTSLERVIVREAPALGISYTGVKKVVMEFTPAEGNVLMSSEAANLLRRAQVGEVFTEPRDVESGWSMEKGDLAQNPVFLRNLADIDAIIQAEMPTIVAGPLAFLQTDL